MVDEGVASSPQYLRRLNTTAVLRHMLEAGPVAARELIEATGLTRATVLSLCDELVALGWLQELDDARVVGQQGKGRPARRYGLHPRAGYVIGVDAGQHRITAVCVSLRGEILAKVERLMRGDIDDPRARLRTTRAAVDSVLRKARVGKNEVLVTVAGVPAPTDDAGASPQGHDGYWAHMNPGFAHALASYGRVIVENDANLAAIAENATGAGVGTSSCVTLLSGERLGSGLIIDGRILRGAHGGAGEMRLLDIVEGVGSADGFGALAREWAREASAARRIPHSSPLAAVPLDELDAIDVFEAAAAGDATASDILRRLGDRLARIGMVVASLLDVERVVVAGAMAGALEPVVARAQEVLRADSYEPLPEIVASSLGGDSVITGAIEHGLAVVRDDPLSLMRAATEVESEAGLGVESGAEESLSG